MNSSSNLSRKETERTKLIQEKCQTLLTQMLRDEDNKYCVDCDAKGPRWASWNLGVFLCIRCAGIHRNLGVHISRVKSVNLDTWTPEQVISLQQMGNSRARAVYEAQLPDGFRRPQTDTALESFIRAKYEHKKYLAREWVPPSPPKVDWAKEIDDELERQKRKKKSTQMNSALGIGNLNATEKKTTTNVSAKTTPLPAPLPKPKSNQSLEGTSPKTQRTHNSSTSESNHTNNDLLGLSSPTKPLASQAGTTIQTNTDLVNDSFSNFLSAAPATSQATAGGVSANKSVENSLAQEEEDFFNQGAAIGGEKDKSGKLTKDSILALYGTSSTAASSMFAGQPQPMYGMAPAYMGATTGGMPPQAQQQHQHQFMTPPNSTSMYNAPVMTAPTAFSTPAMGGLAVNNAFGSAQFGYAPPPQQQSPLVGMGLGAGIMATGQAMTAANVNLMQTNQNLLSGVNMMAPTPMMGGLGMPMNNTMSPFQTTAGTVAGATGGNTTALNQQFGNLNIGNVWQ